MPGGKLSSYISHARYKIPNASQAHAASNTGDSLVFPETTGHFLLLGLAVGFAFHKFPLQLSNPMICSRGLLGSAPLAGGCPSRKGTTNTSGSSHFPPTVHTHSGIFFPHLDAYYEFFSMPTPHHELSCSYNQFAQYFPLVMTKARYLYTWHHFICNHSHCF